MPPVQKLHRYRRSAERKRPLNLKMKNTDSGVVLVTVVIITFVMMILVIGLLSAHVNQSTSTEHQVERIKAEELAKGVMWMNHMYLSTVTTANSFPGTITATMDGKAYTSSVTLSGTTLYNSRGYTTAVTYNP